MMRGKVGAMKAILFVLILSSRALADCGYFLEAHGAFQYNRQQFGESCYLSVHPRQALDLVYRSFLFTSEGQLMVFNSFGEGDSSKMTAARVFFFFPRTGTPEMEVLKEEVRISFSVFSFYFSQGEARVSGMDGGKATESSKVIPQNRGGIEFAIERGLMLDAGFAVGFDPTSRQTNKANFIDRQGLSCEITNREVFTYSEEGDPSFRFTDEELKAFLAVRCPQLSF
jgi:hypothetical protein